MSIPSAASRSAARERAWDHRAQRDDGRVPAVGDTHRRAPRHDALALRHFAAHGTQRRLGKDPSAGSRVTATLSPSCRRTTYPPMVASALPVPGEPSFYCLESQIVGCMV